MRDKKRGNTVGLIVLFCVAFMVMANGARAQTLEPRMYSNLPVGLNFLLVGYGYSQGEVLVDPSVPLDDLNARIHMPVFAYLRSFAVMGRASKVDIVLPFAWLSGSAKVEGQEERVYREISGLADLSVRFNINLYGAPALSLKEFASYRQNTIFGVSLQVTAPVGQYDSSRLVNISSHRWTFKPEIGLSQAIGRWNLETSAALSIYTTNNNFWDGKIRKQNPILSLQGHTIYNFKRGVWASFDITFYRGGQTTIDGEVKNDLQTNWRLGATLAFPLNRRNSIKLYASSGVYTRTGTAFSLLGIAWQYRWGGGV